MVFNLSSQNMVPQPHDYNYVWHLQCLFMVHFTFILRLWDA